jgi:predicted 3-demethylubiquinone-9 3-methyltransferase (glyoxalase superfamily)
MQFDMNDLTWIKTDVGIEDDFSQGIALNVNCHDYQEVISREVWKLAYNYFDHF